MDKDALRKAAAVINSNVVGNGQKKMIAQNYTVDRDVVCDKRFLIGDRGQIEKMKRARIKNVLADHFAPLDQFDAPWTG